MKSFDFYEFVAILIPGLVILYGELVIFYPQLTLLTSKSDVSLGNLGLFVVFAYAFGHILQKVGQALPLLNLKPTNWVLENKGNIFPKNRFSDLEKAISKKLKIKIKISKKLPSDVWGHVVMQMYNLVHINNKSERINIFQGNTALCRGLMTAFGILAISVAIRYHLNYIWNIIILVALSLISYWRMRDFSKHYAKELFRQFMLQ